MFCEFDATNFMSQDEDLHNTVVPDILKSNCAVDEDDIDDIPVSTCSVLTYIGGYNAYAITKFQIWLL